ncbi:MAG: 4Fe-4S binding protein [Peptococcaceae bacterium]|nr:4Fe-4S binding protein [Peptococcaceae bacterium]
MPIPRGKLEINRKWCKGCSLCADACPKGIITVDELGKIQVRDPEICLGCGQCEAICPDFAIRVEKDEKTG